MTFLLRITCLCILLLASGYTATAQPASDPQLAAHYFQSGDYEKALLYYEKLYNRTPSETYYHYYFRCLLELKQYREAEKLVKKAQRRDPQNLRYFVDMGDLYQHQGEVNKAKKEYDNALKALSGSHTQVIELADAFASRNEFDYALKTYERGDKLAGFPLFGEHRAEVYILKGDYPGAFTEFFSLLHDDRISPNLSRIENRLAAVLKFDREDDPQVELFRTELLKRIQKHPNNEYYYELLIWFFQQKSDFTAAFNQVKAIDKRKREDGLRVFNFGMLCLSNENYDIAAQAFEYVVREKGSTGTYYLDSKIKLVEVLSEKVIQRGIYEEADLLALEKNYLETLQELGKHNATVPLMRGLARVRAFYLHDTQSAEEMLEEAIRIPGLNALTLAECKMDLGDILLLQSDIWDASLYYSQVEKAFKHEPIGHEAKFRNARISFYTGDFEWARAQLDVLKASTSKLISNDAMQLSLLITDNLAYDSIPEALRMYSQADLLAYQNRFTEAEAKLDTLNKRFPWHALQDESHYLRYRIAFKQRDYEKAAKELQIIADQFSRDILADDALYYLGELWQFYFKDEEKAAEYYKKLMFDHPGSLYVVEARKRYRRMRGENIN